MLVEHCAGHAGLLVQRSEAGPDVRAHVRRQQDDSSGGIRRSVGRQWPGGYTGKEHAEDRCPPRVRVCRWWE